MSDPVINYKTAELKPTIDNIKDLSPEELEQIAIEQQREKNRKDCERIAKNYKDKIKNTDLSDISEEVIKELEAVGDVKRDNLGIEDSEEEQKENSEENVFSSTIVDNDTDKTIKAEKPWLFKKGQSGNPQGRPKKEKKSIGSVIEAKLNDEKLEPDKYEMHKFVDRLFTLFYDNSKSPMTAGSEILNRYDGKVKDILEVKKVIEHIPDQAEMLKLDERFRIDHKPIKEAEIISNET